MRARANATNPPAVVHSGSDSILDIIRQTAAEAAARAVASMVENLRQRPIVMPAILSAQGAAAYCGYSEAQWTTFQREGLTPPSILFSKNTRRFRVSDLDKWIANGGPSALRKAGAA